MRKRAVGFCHFVCVFFFLYGSTLVIISLYQLQSQAVGHAHAFAGAGSLYEPHGSQVLLALALYFKGNLVVGATDAAGAGFHMRLNILQGLLENFKRVVNLKLVGSFLHTGIYQALCNLLFAVAHNAVDNAGNVNAVIQAIRVNFAYQGFRLVAWHYLLSFLAPYLLRAFLRLFTPW